MKKYFSKILIAIFILGIFLAPISPSIKINKKLYNIKNVSADTIYYFEYKTKAKNTEIWPTKWVRIKNLNGEPACIDKIGSLKKEIDEQNRDVRFTECLPSGNDFSKEDYEKAREASTTYEGKPDFDHNCSLSGMGLVRCLLSVIHTIIFKPISFFAGLSARILDYFVYYSIDDANYRGSGENEKDGFIYKGWSTIRDLANIFFIIALLYVAIKTVLGLNGTNNKKLIGTIILVALVINFSLFITRVVIDSTNILAHVFYKQIEPKSADGKDLENFEKEKSITLGLVKQFNPQKTFESITKTTDITKKEDTYATLLILSIIIAGYMLFMFLSVALFFVSRVIMLWILMIFSPIAFISYTIPEIKIPGFGKQEFWPELFKNAFLAPIFIFFLYIIISFKTIIDSVSEKNVLNDFGELSYMKVIIPFMLILVLLMKLKTIATTLAGEMGKQIADLGKKGAGLAVGAAAGIAAFGGTRLIGGASNLLGNKFGEKLKGWGFDEKGNAKAGFSGYASRQFGKLGLKTFDKGMTSSFDLRKTKLADGINSYAKLDLKNNLLGSAPKEGGLAGARDRKYKELEKEKELYKSNMSNEETKEWSQKNRNKYNEDMVAYTQAQMNNRGISFADARDNFIKERGEAPKVYEKTEDLNKDRMNAFRDSLGKGGLLNSVAYSITGVPAEKINQNTVETDTNFMNTDIGKMYIKKLKKKRRRQALEQAEANNQLDTFNGNQVDADFDQEIENIRNRVPGFQLNYDEQILNSAKEEAVKNTKLKLGVGAAGVAIATGGLAGGWLGASSAMYGIGTNVVGGVDDLASKKMIKSMTKETDALSKVQDRIEELNNILEKGKTLTRTPASNIIIPGQPPPQPIPINLFTNNKLDYEKLLDATSNNEKEVKKEEIKLNTNPNDPLIGQRLEELYKERTILNSLKTAERQLLELTGKKNELTRSSSSTPSTGGGTARP